MLRGFTIANSILKFPTTTDEFIKQITNRLDEEESGSTRQSCPSITLSSSQRALEDAIFRVHKHKNERTSHKGVGTSFRLYKIDGKKLSLLKAKIISAQDIVDEHILVRKIGTMMEATRTCIWFGTRYQR
jgi:hypothetical protein